MQPSKRTRIETMNTSTHPALLGSLKQSKTAGKLINFSPGPTSLPEAVEERIADSFKRPGLTSLALSHRSPEFIDIIDRTKASVRRVMGIPDHYEVLFTHGGGHGQFAAVPLNLCHKTSDVATYVVNGTWTERARDEALRYCAVQTIDGRDSMGGYTTFPELKEKDIDTNSRFFFLCSNETVNGIENHRLPKLPESRRHIPLVIDASSDFTTKPIDWQDDGVGVLFACASKNIGHPGVTLTVVRKDLLGNEKFSPLCPGVFNYTTNAEADNLWNTPATFNIEVIGFLMEWLEREGGVAANERRSIAKSSILYDVIDNSGGFYRTPVQDKSLRSRMNVPFNVNGGDENLTSEFLIQSWNEGMVGLRTLTPFGVGSYLRASLYNCITVEDAAYLADFMKRFAGKYQMK
jgi:phosphoserine aminotransferase